VAGAMQYPARKFLAALTFGRICRYTILAYVAGLYGHEIIGFIEMHGHPVAVAIIGIVIAVAVLVIYFWRGGKDKESKWNLGERLF
jgi:membrane protein DedA with SNARE-associated domain